MIGLSALAVLTASISFAQGEQDEAHHLEGQLRHRLEVDARNNAPGRDAVAFQLLRSRLGFRAFPTARTEVFLQVQDSRVMGEEASTLDGSANAFDLHQGFVTLKRVFGRPLDIQAGRFETVYGSERLVGAVGWHNVGRSFDGVRLRWSEADVDVDAFHLQIREELREAGEGDVRFMGTWLEGRWIDGLTTNVFALWERATPSDLLSRYTTGAELTGRFGAFDPRLELAYQGGRADGERVSAYMAAFRIDARLAYGPLDPVVSAGVDLLSGDDHPGSGTRRVFHTLYATNHKYYGLMDLFVSLPADTYGGGLRDYHLGTSVAPRSKIRLHVDVHHFRSDKPVALSSGTARTFGTEVDATVAVAFDDATSISLGGALFAPAEIEREKRSRDTFLWGYVMTVVNF
ncbi:MAG: alginate export family protein [Rhodothermales bacterium]